MISLAPPLQLRVSQHRTPIDGLAKAAIGLELFLSAGALAGGAILFLSPDGSRFGMPLAMLEHSGFENFRIPGAMLFVVHGLFPLVSAFAVRRRFEWAPATVLLVGVLLVGWIAVQVLLIRSFYAPLHGTYLALGVAIAALGLAMWRPTRGIRAV